jgi:hypothetical protein
LGTFQRGEPEVGLVGFVLPHLGVLTFWKAPSDGTISFSIRPFSRENTFSEFFFKKPSP